MGAGFAGLAAALRLKQANANVLVLEARNRVGGRTLTTQMKGGGWIGFGGQWVGPDQHAFHALIKEVGGETYPSPEFGAMLQRSVLDPSKFIRVDDEVSGSYPGSELVEAGYQKVDALAASIDPEKPWAHPDAERLDALTFAEWLRQNIEYENTRAQIGSGVSSIACASEAEISILEMAFPVRACKGLDKLFSTKGGDSRTG